MVTYQEVIIIHEDRIIARTQTYAYLVEHLGLYLNEKRQVRSSVIPFDQAFNYGSDFTDEEALIDFCRNEMRRYLPRGYEMHRI